MDVLTQCDVKKRFGAGFCSGFYTIVDENAGKARIIEGCVARGPIEWDAVNRKRAGGIVEVVRVEGARMEMDVRIGRARVSFGAVSRKLGGQALESLKVVGNEVHTTWLGIAGASVGIGACLAQAPGVLRAEYDDVSHVGGAHKARVMLVTKKLARVVYAIDDTDTKYSGATWALALRMAREPSIARIATMLDHKIVQLNPDVKEKTTNCCATGVSFAVEPSKIETLTKKIVEYVKKRTTSSETCVAIFEGLKMPRSIVEYGMTAKRAILKPKSAFRVAENSNVAVKELTGARGAIGAVACIGCFDLGMLASALPTDILQDVRADSVPEK